MICAIHNVSTNFISNLFSFMENGYTLQFHGNHSTSNNGDTCSDDITFPPSYFCNTSFTGSTPPTNSTSSLTTVQASTMLMSSSAVLFPSSIIPTLENISESTVILPSNSLTLVQIMSSTLFLSKTPSPTPMYCPKDGIRKQITACTTITLQVCSSDHKTNG